MTSEHEKRHLPRAVDLELHMESVRAWRTSARNAELWARQLQNMSTTLGYAGRPETQHEQNVREYVAGIIDHDEYERREGSRLAREAGSATSGTGA